MSGQNPPRDRALSGQNPDAPRGKRARIARFAIVGADFFANRKVRRAGPHGALVFLHALLCNARGARDGSFSASDLEPWFLSETLKIGEAEATEGLQRAIVARLLEVEGETARIVGWDPSWERSSRSESERRGERRKKQKQISEADVEEEVEVEEPGSSPDMSGRAVAFFIDQYERTYGARCLVSDQQQEAFGDLVQAHGLDEVTRRAANMFGGACPWLKGGRDAAVFLQHFDKFVRSAEELGEAEPIRKVRAL